MMQYEQSKSRVNRISTMMNQHNITKINIFSQLTVFPEEKTSTIAFKIDNVHMHQIKQKDAKNEHLNCVLKGQYLVGKFL